jgi:oligopeptide/dipeptide ABC transporter ATP-binding protein
MPRDECQNQQHDAEGGEVPKVLFRRSCRGSDDGKKNRDSEKIYREQLLTRTTENVGAIDVPAARRAIRLPVSPEPAATVGFATAARALNSAHTELYNSLVWRRGEKVQRVCIPAYHRCMPGLLTLRGLVVELPTPAGWVRPVNEVSLRIAEGEAVGLVGESGSGKTMMALAMMGLLPLGARVKGEARFEEGKEVDEKRRAAIELTKLTESEWRAVRGRDIAMVFQEPMTALNPVMRVGAQIEEAVRAHEPKLAREDVRQRMLESLRRAAVPEPETRAEQFPHQLSGGLRQRAMIAMALAGGPRLLIADEPTTALDVTVQKQILDLLDRLRRELRLGLLFITHDLGVVAQVADRIAVMYAGRMVEEGPVGDVLRAPRHPYTQGLLAASPTLERGKLAPIPGTVPQLTALPPGCAFEPRCAVRVAECVTRVPEMKDAGAEHGARCVLV